MADPAVTAPGAAAAALDPPLVPSPPVPPVGPLAKRAWLNRRFVYGLLVGLVLACCLALAAAVAWEMYSSYLQSRVFSRLAHEARYHVEPGASPSIRFPQAGPYDERMGYSALPAYVQRLKSQSYAVAAQARMSPRMVSLMDLGLFPAYPEKAQAGLTVLDCRATPMYSQRFPERVYQHFDEVPALVVAGLLFIENRELLDASQAERNPAVEWDRFGRAVFDQLWHQVDARHEAPGGSTLATQIEKYRHSPGGRTEGPLDKLRQMASASLRAYSLGSDTTQRRRQIVLDYLNTVPLIARAGFGEIHGVGDGLWAWYGRDFDSLNRALSSTDEASLAARALAFKQVLSLMVAQRRPAHYLDAGEADLQALTHAYLRLMAQAGAISPALRDAALAQPLQRLARVPERSTVSYLDRKAATAARNRVAALLGIQRVYDLDRLDLIATSSLDAQVQAASTAKLLSLATPAGAQAAGLYGFHLLNPGDDTSRLTLSFTLFERGEGANYLRVQTDNLDQPFDLNDGARLDLGSTSKLRTLVTYLELIAELHGRWEALEPQQLAALSLSPKDVLSYWARDYLVSAKGPARSLQSMLEAAMQRRYSASPYEGFYTGGGLHHFENFDPDDNGRIVTVAESLRRSVNLSFIRIMRDVATHLIYRSEAAGGEAGAVAVLEEADSPERKALLARFADKEGRTYLYGFYANFKGKQPQAVEKLLLGRRQPTAARLAAVFYELMPAGTVAELSAFLDQHLGPDRKRLVPDAALAERYSAGRFTLADRAYVASVHPLALWLAAHLRGHPQATWAEVVEASQAQRQAAYAWLFKTRHKGAQDVRIRSLLEQRAFEDINQRWRRLGYPFDRLTPSYAAALGASGDRPAALAELMGIIVNEGVRLPVARIPRLHFAAATPYETRLDFQAKAEREGEQVLEPEIARVVRAALIDVVDNGTARRLSGALIGHDGKPVAIGGKTGTGDQRFDVYGKGGVLLSSRVVNRTATLVFLIGERYFGTVMAYVHEPYAADYKFTSALPAQLLKSLAPTLLPLLDDGHCSEAGAATAASASQTP